MNVKKLVFKEGDNISTQFLYVELAEEPPTAWNDQSILVFWVVGKTKERDYEPVFLNDPNLDKYLKFEYIQAKTDYTKTGEQNIFEKYKLR